MVRMRMRDRWWELWAYGADVATHVRRSLEMEGDWGAPTKYAGRRKWTVQVLYMGVSDTVVVKAKEQGLWYWMYGTDVGKVVQAVWPFLSHRQRARLTAKMEGLT